MSVLITSACIRCGACIWECPTEAIAPGDPIPVVERHRCTECLGFFGESQCVVVCPVRAITTLEEPVEALAARFADLHPQGTMADVGIWHRLPAAFPLAP